MTTVTEHRFIRKASDLDVPSDIPEPPSATQQQKVVNEMPPLPVFSHISSASVESMKNDMNATVIPKFNNSSGTANAITGILKGGKLRKSDQPLVRHVKSIVNFQVFNKMSIFTVR